MSSELNNAVNKLADKAVAADKPNDAMQYSQAALNLAHAAATFASINSLKK